MKAPNDFRTRRLTGRPPSPADAALYSRVFGAHGRQELERNLQDHERHRVAPWSLQCDGTDVGVGGCRIGFGRHEGLELVLALSPGPLPVGLAAEFLSDALLFVVATLRADRVFAFTDSETALSCRMLGAAGFVDAGPAPLTGRPDRRIMRWTASSPNRA